MTSPVVAVALSLLLLVNVAWSVALYRRLARIDDGREKLEVLVREFDEAVAKARESMGELRRELDGIATELRRYGEGARLRSDQLGRLLEAGERLARRLEGAIERAARTRAEMETARATDAATSSRGSSPRSPAEVESRSAAAGEEDEKAPTVAPAVELPAELRRLMARLR
ncbi:hypothetical protein HRbin40_00612 [bacterium HR40]|nr:hypothetical protein HRbin40_00612 [bacterium HR40]